jgi:cyclohexa-1,5-dienecarbonyl-CoA hydratase
MSDRIGVRRDGRLGQITLQAGPLNVLGTDDVRHLTQAIYDLGDCTVVVLAAEGRAFCAGMDIADHIPERAHAMLRAFAGLAHAFSIVSPITIAKVGAQAIGGGFELALLCDLIVTSEQACFALPEVKLAALPPVACALLAKVAGEKRALDLILTGRSIDGVTAERWGIVSRCVRPEELDLAVDNLCHDLLTRSADALASCKSAAQVRTIEDSLRIYEDSLLRTHDASEGIHAFLEKREPHWHSRRHEEATR